MRRVYTREQYLSQYKKHYSVNEMIENDVNWGDSLVGRLFNSILRKGEIGYNMMRMKNIIKLLKNKFEVMNDDVQLSDLPAKEKITIHVAARLHMLSEKIVSGSSYKKIIQLVVEAEEALDQVKDQEGVDVVYEKLGEYKTFLLDGVKEEGGEESDFDASKALGQGDAPDIDKSKVKELGEETGDPLELPRNLTLELIPKYIERYKQAIQKVKQEMQKDAEEAKKIPVAKKKVKDTKEFKKMYRQIAKYIHSDYRNNDASIISTIGDDKAKEILQKVTKAYQDNDEEAMKGLWEKMEILVKKHKTIKEYEKVLNELTSKQKDAQNGNSDKTKLIGDGSDNGKEVQVQKETRMSHLSGYVKFYEKKVGVEVTTEEMKSKFEEIFTQDVIAEFTITKEKVTEFKKYERSPKLVMRNPDHIIEIVRLFKRAYRLHTTSVIPSGRTGGKVSNRVFREYENLGSNSGGSPEQPGPGPWRNVKLYDQWENAVMDILADNRYKTTIFSDECEFHFESDGSTVKSGKKSGKILLNFITKLLADSKMYTGSGALPTFLKEYFGLTVDLSDTAMTHKGKSDNDVVQEVSNKIVKTKVKYVDQRNVGELSGLSLFDWFEKLKNESTKLPNGIAFRIKSKGEWVYFVLAKQKKDVIYFYYLSRFGFDMTNIEIKEEYSRSQLYLSIFFDGGSKMRYVNVNGKTTKENDKLSLDDVEVLVDLHGKLFKKLRVLGGVDFESTSGINVMKKLTESPTKD